MIISARESLKSWVKARAWAKPVLREINHSRCEAWDLIHGVDTCGKIPLSGLDFDSKNKTAGLEYQSHHPALTRSALMELPVQYDDYSFIDIGCGKGRVLLIASEFPFRRIIGVEFAPTLAEIARKNLRSYRRAHTVCTEIEVVTGDALEYNLAPEAQVLYFFSPFSPSVLDQIVQRIEDSFQRSPRDLLVMFSGVIPMRERAFGWRPQYERLSRKPHMDVYRHR